MVEVLGECWNGARVIVKLVLLVLMNRKRAVSVGGQPGYYVCNPSSCSDVPLLLRPSPQNRYPGTLSPARSRRYPVAEGFGEGGGALESHCGQLAAQIQRGGPVGDTSKAQRRRRRRRRNQGAGGVLCAVGVCPARAKEGCANAQRRFFQWPTPAVAVGRAPVGDSRGARHWSTGRCHRRRPWAVRTRVARCRSEIGTDRYLSQRYRSNSRAAHTKVLRSHRRLRIFLSFFLSCPCSLFLGTWTILGLWARSRSWRR